MASNKRMQRDKLIQILGQDPPCWASQQLQQAAQGCLQVFEVRKATQSSSCGIKFTFRGSDPGYQATFERPHLAWDRLL